MRAVDAAQKLLGFNEKWIVLFATKHLSGQKGWFLIDALGLKSAAKTNCCLLMIRKRSMGQRTSLANYFGMRITVTRDSRDCKDEKHTVEERKEVCARQPNRSRGAFSALKMSQLRTDLLQHRAAVLREMRATDLGQLPVRHVRLCVNVGATQTRARQNRGHVHPLDGGRECLLAGANE